MSSVRSVLAQRVLAGVRAAVLAAVLTPIVAAGQGMAQAQEVAETAPTDPVAAFGVSSGVPAYQSGSALVSVQYLWGGVALRAGYGAAGVQGSLDLRGYPPVPIPVPTYGAVGINLYGARVAYHAALGAHVPLTLRWRLDLEAGVAWVPLGFDRAVTPHAVVGVSYAIPFEAGAVLGSRPSAGGSGALSGAATAGRGAQAGGCTQVGDPSPAGIERAVERVVRTYLSDARAVYGSVYADLRYDYDIAGAAIDGLRADVALEYSGSVREIATGERLRAEGDAVARLAWTGCRWAGVGLEY